MHALIWFAFSWMGRPWTGCLMWSGVLGEGWGGDEFDTLNVFWDERELYASGQTVEFLFVRVP